MIFCIGDQKSITIISNILNDYVICYDQFCNKAKSLIYADGMSHDRHQRLADLIGFTIATHPSFTLEILFLYEELNILIADRIRIKLAA